MSGALLATLVDLVRENAVRLGGLPGGGFSSVVDWMRGLPEGFVPLLLRWRFRLLSTLWGRRYWSPSDPGIITESGFIHRRRHALGGFSGGRAGWWRSASAVARVHGVDAWGRLDSPTVVVEFSLVWAVLGLGSSSPARGLSPAVLQFDLAAAFAVALAS